MLHSGLRIESEKGILFYSPGLDATHDLDTSPQLILAWHQNDDAEN